MILYYSFIIIIDFFLSIFYNNDSNSFEFFYVLYQHTRIFIILKFVILRIEYHTGYRTRIYGS